MLFSIFARLTIFLMMPMAAFAVSASLLGETQPIHPALRGFVEGCENIPQPCWYGIVPEQTPLNEALIKIEQLGFIARQGTTAYGIYYHLEADTCDFFVYADEVAIVSYISGESCQALRLGDFITVLGIPLVVVGRSMCDPNPISYEGIGFLPQVSYHRNLSVQMDIDSFYLTSAYTRVIRPWRDFQPYGHFGRAAHRSPRRCG